MSALPEAPYDAPVAEREPFFAEWWADLDRCLSDLCRRGAGYREAKRRRLSGATPEAAARAIAKHTPRVEGWL